MILSDLSILKSQASTKENEEENFFQSVLVLGFSLVNSSCSLKCIKKHLVNYSYFGSCPRSGEFEYAQFKPQYKINMEHSAHKGASIVKGTKQVLRYTRVVVFLVKCL